MKWESVELETIAEVIAGQSPPSKFYNSKQEGKPFFQGKADFGDFYPTVRYWTTKTTKTSLPNDILFSVRAPVGSTNINNVKACIGRGVAAIRISDKLNLKYLLHFFRYFEPRIKNLGTGSTFKAITIKTLKKIKIPLPPLPIQKQIANLLDTADDLRRTTAKQLQQLEELAESVFLEMFGDIKSNSKNWKIKPFDYFAKFDTKMTTDFEKYANHPHIGISNIEKKTGRLFNYNTVKDDHLKSGKYIFSPNHIIYSKIRPNLNKVALPNFHGLTSADSYPILVTKNSNKIFFTFLLRSEAFLDFILQHSSRTNIPKANKKQMMLFQGIAPPLNLQNEFAKIIKNIEDQKADLKKALQDSEDLFNSLLQTIFS